jgi:hypothetical protein
MNLLKKNIAVLISGQYRNLNEHFDSYANLKKHFNKCDLFFSTWDEPGCFDQKKIGNVLYSKFGIKLPILPILFPVKSKFSKEYVLGSSIKTYKTKKYVDIVHSNLPVMRYFRDFSIRQASDKHNNIIDGIKIPQSLIKAEPVAFRGVLQMLDRNIEGLRLIEQSDTKYDFILRLQSEVFLKENFIDDFNLLNEHDFVYANQSIFPDIQANSKIFFGKFESVKKILSLKNHFKENISNSKFDFSSLDYKDVPIGERYYKQSLDRLKINYINKDLNILINRQKFNPIKPKWMKREDTFHEDNKIIYV